MLTRIPEAVLAACSSRLDAASHAKFSRAARWTRTVARRPEAAPERLQARVDAVDVGAAIAYFANNCVRHVALDFSAPSTCASFFAALGALERFGAHLCSAAIRIQTLDRLHQPWHLIEMRRRRAVADVLREFAAAADRYPRLVRLEFGTDDVLRGTSLVDLARLAPSVVHLVLPRVDAAALAYLPTHLETLRIAAVAPPLLDPAMEPDPAAAAVADTNAIVKWRTRLRELRNLRELDLDDQSALGRAAAPLSTRNIYAFGELAPLAPTLERLALPFLSCDDDGGGAPIDDDGGAANVPLPFSRLRYLRCALVDVRRDTGAAADDGPEAQRSAHRVRRFCDRILALPSLAEWDVRDGDARVGTQTATTICEAVGDSKRPSSSLAALSIAAVLRVDSQLARLAATGIPLRSLSVTVCGGSLRAVLDTLAAGTLGRTLLDLTVVHQLSMSALVATARSPWPKFPLLRVFSVTVSGQLTSEHKAAVAHYRRVIHRTAVAAHYRRVTHRIAAAAAAAAAAR